MRYLKLYKNNEEYQPKQANVSHIVSNVEIHTYTPPNYLKFVALEDTTFKIVDTTSSNMYQIQYSVDDGESWNNLQYDEVTPTVRAGNKILWKSVIESTGNIPLGNFISTGKYKLEGNIMSLVYGDECNGKTDLTNRDFVFRNLFSADTNVVDAVNLLMPATTLSDGCYGFMFLGCTSLKSTPKLPATNLAAKCYQYMFYGCSSLEFGPELAATELKNLCYKEMFFKCSSLKVAPILNATTLAERCYYNMFGSCTLLTVAPELPATQLAEGCYSGMFGGCTSLTTAPDLLALTLVSECYSSMFRGCGSLNYVKALFITTPSDTYTKYWLFQVSSSGTFVKNSAATWDVTGTNAVPSNWTVEYASA